MILKLQKLSIVVLGISLMAASPTPNSGPICQDIVNACDKALDAKDREIEAQGQVVKILEKAHKDDRTLIHKQEKDLDSVFRNPTLLVGAGVIGGLLGPVTAAAGIVLSVLLKAAL